MSSKIDKFDIELDRKRPRYRCGETIAGSLRFQVKEQLAISTLRMHMQGDCEGRWKQGDSNRMAYELMVNYRMPFLSNPSGDQQVILAAGDYNYRFEIVIPDDLPASYELSKGMFKCHVQYYLEATMVISSFSRNKTVRKPFEIVSSCVDLNLEKYRALQLPTELSVSKRLCCFCCASEPIELKLSINKAAFMPGEKIEFKASVNNQSTRSINWQHVKLMQEVRFRKNDTQANEFEKHLPFIKELKTEKLDDRQVAPKTAERWDHRSLVIPKSCCSSIFNCPVAEIGYYVALVVNPAGPSLKAMVKIPITIGDVAFGKEAGQNNEKDLENDAADAE